MLLKTLPCLQCGLVEDSPFPHSEVNRNESPIILKSSQNNPKCGLLLIAGRTRDGSDIRGTNSMATSSN
jgi:hypothetical protein